MRPEFFLPRMVAPSGVILWLFPTLDTCKATKYGVLTQTSLAHDINPVNTYHIMYMPSADSEE